MVCSLSHGVFFFTQRELAGTLFTTHCAVKHASPFYRRGNWSLETSNHLCWKQNHRKRKSQYFNSDSPFLDRELLTTLLCWLPIMIQILQLNLKYAKSGIYWVAKASCKPGLPDSKLGCFFSYTSPSHIKRKRWRINTVVLSYLQSLLLRVQLPVVNHSLEILNEKFQK